MTTAHRLSFTTVNDPQNRGPGKEMIVLGIIAAMLIILTWNTQQKISGEHINIVFPTATATGTPTVTPTPTATHNIMEEPTQTPRIVVWTPTPTPPDPVLPCDYGLVGLVNTGDKCRLFAKGPTPFAIHQCSELDPKDLPATGRECYYDDPVGVYGGDDIN